MDPFFERLPRTVTIATLIGLVAASIGFIDGIVVMAKRTALESCPDGTFFPAGTTNFTCYVHPRATEGLAYSTISLGVGVVVVLLAYLSLVASRGSATH